jgi:hypothetical protein
MCYLIVNNIIDKTVSNETAGLVAGGRQEGSDIESQAFGGPIKDAVRRARIELLKT